jgi:hypothetical protein
MVWRGGERFQRCLESIVASRGYFGRVVLSVTGTLDSEDMQLAVAAQEIDSSIEVICTGRELPTMQHQDFWIDHLVSTGVLETDWIFWLAYDDQVRSRGLELITDDDANWPLQANTAYFGPWAMRHEDPQMLWRGDASEDLESWTSFPLEGPTRLPVVDWIGGQLVQPTYMQMSGSVNEFRSFLDLKNRRPRKHGPMRIEMVIAAAPQSRFVAEFSEPVSIIYGRSDSDRASYGKTARREDIHLGVWLLRYAARNPQAIPRLTRILIRAALHSVLGSLGYREQPDEEWRTRGNVRP